MELQEIYDKVKAHLLAQGKPSKNDSGDCLYRGNDGYKCAAGCLIPDELYVPKMEGQKFSSLCRSWSISGHDPIMFMAFFRFEGADDRRVKLIDELQRIHDDVVPELWYGYLKLAAVHYNLTP
jgi:hypothetical protein